jgi:hypothetical protein
MTLKEKFKQWLDTDPREQIREVPLEIIADEFAIGFAEWIFNDWLADERWSKISDEKELLEIYKKEKEL